MHSVEIRAMASTDAEPVARLGGALGYEATASDIQRRFARLNGFPDHAVFVAVDKDAIVGWAHVCGVLRLQSDGYAEIGGIVVAASHRRRGTGRRLIRQCENWGIEADYSRMRLRSGLQRDDAHAFYLRIGYEQRRASYAFERSLSAGAEE